MKSGFLLSKAERQARGLESKAPAPSHHELLSGRALVTSLVEHSMKLLHHDLEGFFEAYADRFVQDEEELKSGQGETLEQWDAYKARCHQSRRQLLHGASTQAGNLVA